MENRLKRKIAAGEKVLGTFFGMLSVIAADCVGYSGLDYFILDAEHGPGDVESTLPCILAAQRSGVTPLVRTKDSARSSILKMLDIGAGGLVVPYIKTVEEVERLIEYARYAPIGNRGYATAMRANGFGFQTFAKDLTEYYAISNQETLILPQCETMGCYENIDTIVGMEGIDGIFVGPYDLSIALGIPGQMDSPLLEEAIANILAACKKANKISLVYAVNTDIAQRRFDQGYDAVACNMDTTIYVQAMRDMVDKLMKK